MNKIINKNGISFISSAENSQVYYYAGSEPRAVVVNQVPQVSYKIYRNKNKYYATLDIQSELKVSNADARIAARQAGIPASAVILPLQLISSLATLSIPSMADVEIDASTGNGNKAILQFSQTDEANIALLKALLEDAGSAPVGICYKQDFLYQLPPSIFELEADWSSVYTYLKTNVGFNAIIFSVDVEKISSTLIEDKTVTIKTRNTDPNSHVKEAGEELTSILLSEFFVPAFNEVKDSGSKPLFGFYLQKTEVTATTSKRLTARISETTVVQRSIFPQTLFSGFVDGLNYDPATAISETDLPDTFFQKRKINVSLIDEEIDANVTLVLVNLKYGKNTDTAIFSADNLSTKTFEWSSVELPGGEMDWEVKYRFTLFFDKEYAGYSQVSSDEFQTDSENLFIDAESLISNYNFHVAAQNNFNWEWYSSVEVSIKAYDINDSSKNSKYSFVLSKDKSSYEYSYFIPKSADYSFDSEFTYYPNSNSPHIQKNFTIPANQDVTAFTKLFDQRTLEITSEYDWNVYKSVMVFASFEYASGKTLNQTLKFNKDTGAALLFSADQPDAAFTQIQLQIILQPISGPSPTPVKILTSKEKITIPQQ